MDGVRSIFRHPYTLREQQSVNENYPNLFKPAMWPFFRQQKNIASTGESTNPGYTPRPLRFAQLVESMGDFSDLKVHDTALKFWLPEPATEAIMELCERNGESMSEALRQFFAQHCYGTYAFQIMNEAIPGLFRDPVPVKFSRAKAAVSSGQKRIETYWVPELGKNVIPIKVWIPARIKTDLQGLADHVGIKLSQYVREIVISRLLGHGTLPKRPEMMDALPLPSADDWCSDMDVAMRQVGKNEYLKTSEGEIRTLFGGTDDKHLE